ncbi:MAG: DMT family transporter [Terriglobia bacterium]|jgi:drug/metabolite transporter (DMT)-like permease
MFSRARFVDWTLLLVCNLIWASQFVMVKLVQQQMGPVFATFFPMTLAMLFLIPVVSRERRQSGSNNDPMPTRDILQFILIGVLGQVVAQLFITWGVRWSLASNAALLMLTLPISTAVMAYFFLDERMTRVRWISFALALVGVMECSGVDWKELNLVSVRFLLGNLMIFLSVNGSAFYNAYSKKLLRRYSPLQVLLYSYYAVFAFLCPITVYTEPAGFINLPHYNRVVWLGLVMLALFQYFLSMVIFLNVLSRLDATQAAVSNYLIPFFGVVIAAIVLHERLTKYMIVGGLLVLASTLLVTVYEEHQRAAETVSSPSA